MQSRFEMIVASELAGERGGLQIEGEMIGVQFPKFKAVVTKWFVPKNAIHAFRAVSYEAIGEPLSRLNALVHVTN